MKVSKIFIGTYPSSSTPICAIALNALTHFVCFCNDARLFHFSYQRYLENQIRSTFGLEGTPVRMTIRQKGDKEG